MRQHPTTLMSWRTPAMIFIQNKYTHIYYSIISNAKSRTLPEDTYTEKHHIIPKSLGGSNAKDNLVVLTAREHFICHWLLTKMLLGDLQSKMVYALIRIASSPYGDRKLTPKKFEIIKSMRRTHTAETKAKISKASAGENNAMYGQAAWSKGLTKETSQKIKETAEKNSGRVAWNKGIGHSSETKQKMSASQKGRTFSEEHKKKLSEGKKGANNPNFGKVPWNKK